MTTTTWGPHAVVLVHRALRRELRLLPVLVRQAGDEHERAARVRSHAEDLLLLLRGHGRLAGELVWPRLGERVGTARPLVERMREQQAHLLALIADAGTGLAAWGGDPVHGRALAALLALLQEAAATHLEELERAVLPLASRTLTPDEWDELARRAVAQVPRGRRPALLGQLLEDTGDAEREAFLAHVPPAARLTYRLVGRRLHAREAAALRIPAPRRGR